MALAWKWMPVRKAPAWVDRAAPWRMSPAVVKRRPAVVKRFEASLEGASERVRRRFYCDNFVDLMGAGLPAEGAVE